MQGCTADYAVVYLTYRLFAAGQAYVAVKCESSMDGVGIEELECSKLTGRVSCNDDTLDEMIRLRDNS